MPTHVLTQKRAKNAQKIMQRQLTGNKKMDIISNVMAHESAVKPCIDQKSGKGYAKKYVEPVEREPQKNSTTFQTHWFMKV